MEAVVDDTIKFLLNDEKYIKKLSGFHQTEIDFYEHLAKTLDAPVPRVFKSLPWKIGEAEGLLQMEDMTEKGKRLSVSEGLNITHIKEIIRYLAHMHRISLTSEDEEFNSWKGKHNDNQLCFTSFCNMLGNPKPFLEVCGDKGEFRLQLS